MLSHFYSFVELDRSLRTTFEIPTDPYDEDPEVKEEAEKYLRELGIFFYRDEENVYGVVVEPNDGRGFMLDRRGFAGFKHLVELTTDFTPDAWARPDKRKIAKEGDDRAWLKFNDARYIDTITESTIKTGAIV